MCAPQEEWPVLVPDKFALTHKDPIHANTIQVAPSIIDSISCLQSVW